MGDRPGSHLGLRSRLDLAPKRLESRQSHHLMTSERLKACQIPTLHYRRIRGDMIETYKIITGKYQGCVAPSFIKEEIYVTKGNDLRLQKLRVRYDMTYANVAFPIG